MSRPRAAAQHRRDAGIERFFQLLWGDEMDVAVNAASSQDFSFARDDFSRWPDDDGYTRLCIRVAGFADGGDAAFFQTHIRFVNP